MYDECYFVVFSIMSVILLGQVVPVYLYEVHAVLQGGAKTMNAQ